MLTFDRLPTVAVVLASAAVALAAFAVTSATAGPSEAIVAGLYAGILAALGLLDLKTGKLPDAVVLPATAVALILAAEGGRWEAFVAAVLGLAFFAILRQIGSRLETQCPPLLTHF